MRLCFPLWIDWQARLWRFRQSVPAALCVPPRVSRGHNLPRALRDAAGSVDDTCHPSVNRIAPSSNQSRIAQRCAIRAAYKACWCIYPSCLLPSKCLLSSFRSTPDMVVYSSCAAACKALYSASQRRTDTVICFS